MLNTQMLAKSILERHNSKIRAPYLDKVNMVIVEDLAKKYSLSEEQIREIVTAPYLLIKTSRQNAEHTKDGFLTFRLPKFGKLIPRARQMQTYLDKKNGGHIHDRREE